MHALPHRSISVRFTPTSRPRQNGLNATLCADFVAEVFLHWRSKILLAVDATFV